METYFVNEKFTRSIGHGYQEVIDGIQLQVSGHMPKKYLPINLFDIHVRLYRCVKIWVVKIWRFFGWSSISPNVSGAKVSLYMVKWNNIPIDSSHQA